MPGKQSRGPRTISRQPDDDFLSIKGIGPSLANRLHHAGILSYRQLASLSPDELSAQVSGLSARQIARQDWIGQARKLAARKVRSGSHAKGAARPRIHQHYENFTIECLLDEKNDLRRTRVVHIQSGDADTWTGWEAEQLIDFLTRHAQVRIPITKKQKEIENVRRASQEVKEESASTLINSHSLVQISPVSRPVPSGMETADAIVQAQDAADLAGTLCLQNLEVTLPDSDLPLYLLRQGEAYGLRLTIDLGDVVNRRNKTLLYQATILLKQLGGSSHTVGEAHGTIEGSESLNLRFNDICLPSGTCRLEAFVQLLSGRETTGLTASLKSDLLYVY